MKEMRKFSFLESHRRLIKMMVYVKTFGFIVIMLAHPSSPKAFKYSKYILIDI